MWLPSLTFQALGHGTSALTLSENSGGLSDISGNTLTGAGFGTGSVTVGPIVSATPEPEFLIPVAGLIFMLAFVRLRKRERA